MSAVQIDEELMVQLQESITEVFEFEILEQENVIVLEFRCDYGNIYGRIRCGKYVSNFYDYTREDLIQKGAAIYNLYVDLHNRFQQNFARSTQLTDKMRFEIANEFERAKRKAQFFDEKDHGKSTALLSEVNFLKKLQKIVAAD